MNSYSIELEETFEVSRSAASCFQYVTDLRTLAEWDRNITSSIRLDEGAIGLGARYDVTLKMGVSTTHMDYEITAYESPRRAVFIGKADGLLAVDTVTVESITEASSRVTWNAVITFEGIKGKIISRFEGYMERYGKKAIEGLKDALEDAYPTPRSSKLVRVADQLVLPGLWKFSKFGYQSASRSWNPVSADIRGRHMVITGATSGLGLASANYLASKGAHLTLVVRNKNKAEKVRADIIRTTENEAVELAFADLSLQRDTLALADELLSRGKAIDVLIHNAGALFNERIITDEGFEQSFSLLLLSPYILTEKLMPLMDQKGRSRVINVSSGGMYSQKIKPDDLQYERGKFDGAAAYARAKRGLVILTEYWASKYAHVGFFAMHPGWADTPGVEDALPGFYKVMKRVLRSAEEGADTINWLAMASELEDSSGSFFLDRQIHPVHMLPATRETDAEREDFLKRMEQLSLEAERVAVANS